MSLPKFVLQSIFNIVCGRMDETWHKLHCTQKLVRMNGTELTFKSSIRCPALGDNMLRYESVQVDGRTTKHTFTCEDARRTNCGLSIQCANIIADVYPDVVVIRAHNYAQEAVSLMTITLVGEHPSLLPYGRIVSVIGDAYLRTPQQMIMGDMTYYPCGDQDGDMFEFRMPRSRIYFNLNEDGKLHTDEAHQPAITRFDIDVNSNVNLRPMGSVFAYNGVTMPETEHARQIDRVLNGLPGPIYDEVSENMSYARKLPIMRNGRRYVHVTSW